MLWFVGAVLGVLLLIALPYLILTAVVAWAMSCGRYSAGLRILNACSWLDAYPIAVRLGYRAYVLEALGRFDEAERDILAAAVPDDPLFVAVDQEHLGKLKMYQGHYDEAEAFFQRSLASNPNRGDTWSSLAELTLRRGGDAGEALAMTENGLQAVRRDPNAPLRVRLGEDPTADIQTRRAWALARLGRTGESEEALAHALRIVSKRNADQLAELHYCAGLMREETDNRRAAIASYAEVVKVNRESWRAKDAARRAGQLEAKP